MKEPLVSVCIPSYNGARFIGETIRSVLDSTYTNLEVIVSDDASTDNTVEIVQGIGDSRVRLYRNERNLGMLKNTKRASEKASGAFVAGLGHDDLCGPFWLSFASHTLQRRPHIGWVLSAYRVIDGEGRTSRVISTFPETGEIVRTEAFLTMGKLEGWGSASVLRRECLEEIQRLDLEDSAVADLELGLVMAARYPLYYSANPHVAWRAHPGSLSATLKETEWATDGFKVLKRRFADATLPEELRRFEQDFHASFCSLVAQGRDQLLRAGDSDTARALDRIRAENGCAD